MMCFKTVLFMIAGTIGLMACDGEGPMGPPGEPGPDGIDGVGGGSGTMAYVTPAGSEIHWDGIDGLGNYGIGLLNVNGYGRQGNRFNGLPLAEEAVSAFNQGGLLLVYVDFGTGWRSLPIMDRPLENSLFTVYLNYELVDGELFIRNRVLSDFYEQFEKDYAVQRLKVVVAEATESGTLTLPGY